MKKILLSLLLVALPVFVNAQSLRFAYFHYMEVLQSMPDYAIATRNMLTSAPNTMKRQSGRRMTSMPNTKTSSTSSALSPLLSSANDRRNFKT